VRPEERERGAQRRGRLRVHRLVAKERERRRHAARRVPLPVKGQDLLDAVASVADERADRPVEQVDAAGRLEVGGHERVAYVAPEQQHALVPVRRLVGREPPMIERVDHR
jgi:hypothetical protein